MQIGLFSRHYHIKYKRGISVYTHELTKALAKIIHKNDVHILDYFFRKAYYENLPIIENKRFKNKVIFCPGRIFSHMNKFFNWPTPTTGMKPLDLVHLMHEYDTPHLKERNIVLTVHDLGPVLFPEIYSKNYRDRWIIDLEQGLISAAKVIGVSETVEDQLKNHYPEYGDKITSTFLGVSEEYLKTADIEKEKRMIEKMGLKTPFLLYIGAADPKKNLKAFLKGFSIYLHSRIQKPLYRLVFVGEKTWGGYEDFRQAIEKYNLHDRIDFTGYIDYSALPALYRSSELFIFPSLFEGFGLPVLEAMASGAPCLISNKPALTEVGSNVAEYFDPDSPENIAEKLDMLLQNPEKLKKMKSVGRNYAKKFTWEKTAMKTVRVYEEVLGIQLI
jgi:glycosyltransferase involved in cell wall biosynthesis